MNNTPETNSRAWSDHNEGILHEVVEANFARKLERERDEVREKAERYRLEANSLMLQRDEARESLKHIGEYGTEEINAAIDLRQKLASALVERDEAREKLDEEMKWHHRTHTELVQTQCKILDMQMGRDEIQEKYDNLATEHMLVVNKLCNERDEAKSISDELAIIASLCLGWHDHESNDTAIKIAAALKRWKKSKVSNEQD